jgi:hypothetical protein
LFALSISSSAPVPCTSVVRLFEFLKRTAGYEFVFSMFQSLERAVCSNSLKNQRTVGYVLLKYV